METKRAIEVLRQNEEFADAEFEDAIAIAISALEFKERYDRFWEVVKSAGKSGKETEIHHSGRVFRIREVSQ